MIRGIPFHTQQSDNLGHLRNGVGESPFIHVYWGITMFGNFFLKWTINFRVIANQ